MKNSNTKNGIKKYGNAEMGFYGTREAWLKAAVTELEARVFAPVFKEANVTPANWSKPIRVTVGWPFGTRGSKRQHAIGQCFHQVCSKDQSVEIFITPAMNQLVGLGVNGEDKDGKRSQGILDVLAHELIHAYVGTQAGHGGPFKAVAVAIGLTGRMTATIPGEDLRTKLEAIARKLGKYPHAALDYEEFNRTRTRQGTRLVKVECPACGCIMRMSRAAIDNCGLPTCGCGTKTVEG